MKTQLNKKTLWQSLLSVIVAVIFIALAAGSLDIGIVTTTTIVNGRYVERELIDGYGNERITSGYRDQYGLWNGEVRITETNQYNEEYEDVVMVNGRRHGRAKITWSDHNMVLYQEYNMGICTNPNVRKDEVNTKAGISAYKVLCNKYPWFVMTLNRFGLENPYVEAYMNAVENTMGANLYDISKFSDYYSDAVDELEETQYENISSLNSKLTLSQGLREMKHAELRLATISRYRSTGSTTFNIICTTYPGYLLTLNTKEVNNEDFKVFCQDMDSRMTGYGALNQQDPFFIDSVDARMFRAIYAIMDAGKSFTSPTGQFVESIFLQNKNNNINVYDEVISLLKPSLSKSTPKQVANVVVMHMLEEYYVPAELIRQAEMEAYFIKGGVKRMPIATTVFEGINSATSATLEGYVIEDGDAAVTSRGIAWATFFAPTNKDNPINSGTGTGNFKVTLTGLTPGTTYYARTFATNSAGTAYGNTVSFVASVTTGLSDNIILKKEFTIYPNPASSLTTFRFQIEESGSLNLDITDMQGQLMLNKEFGNLPVGENQVMLDLSVLRNGLYNCHLTNGKTSVTQKVIISH